MECEARQLDFIIKDVSLQLGINRKNEQVNTSEFQLQGKFTASFGGVNGQAIMPMYIHWHNEKQNSMGFSVSDGFKLCIQSLAECHGFTEKFQVTCYLKVYKKECMQLVMYYAMEYMSGTERYNFAMGQFENNYGSLATCPAKIICFVCYN
jgi:hypothetical protein